MPRYTATNWRHQCAALDAEHLGTWKKGFHSPSCQSGSLRERISDAPVQQDDQSPAASYPHHFGRDLDCNVRFSDLSEHRRLEHQVKILVSKGERAGVSTTEVSVWDSLPRLVDLLWKD